MAAREGLKILWAQAREGSTPSSGTRLARSWDESLKG